MYKLLHLTSTINMCCSVLILNRVHVLGMNSVLGISESTMKTSQVTSLAKSLQILKKYDYIG